MTIIPRWMCPTYVVNDTSSQIKFYNKKLSVALTSTRTIPIVRKSEYSKKDFMTVYEKRLKELKNQRSSVTCESPLRDAPVPKEIQRMKRR